MQFSLTVGYSDPSCKKRKTYAFHIYFCTSQPMPVPIFVVIFLKPGTRAKSVFLFLMIEDRIKQIVSLVKAAFLVNVLDFVGSNISIIYKVVTF